MNGIVRLTDVQLVLLATAARRENGSLLPPPETLGEGQARVRKAVESLIRRGLAAEVEIGIEADAWRHEGGIIIGVIITDAGRSAIAVNEDELPAPSPGEAGSARAPDVLGPIMQPEAPKAVSKSAQVLALLGRSEGATLEELISATGCLPHTTRAALTGLRKRGHEIGRGKRGEQTCYNLSTGAVA
jgi:hypothetical protein